MACKVILKKIKIKRGRDKVKPPRKARMLAGKIASCFNHGLLEVIPLEDSTLIRYILATKAETNPNNFEPENLAEQLESNLVKLERENTLAKQNICYKISISSSDLQQDLDKLAAEIVNNINEWIKV